MHQAFVKRGRGVTTTSIRGIVVRGVVWDGKRRRWCIVCACVAHSLVRVADAVPPEAQVLLENARGLLQVKRFNWEITPCIAHTVLSHTLMHRRQIRKMSWCLM